MAEKSIRTKEAKKKKAEIPVSKDSTVAQSNKKKKKTYE